MLAFGFGLCSWLAPHVWRLLLGVALRVAQHVSQRASARWPAIARRRNAASALPASKA
jgi:hypothetical protein